MGLFSTWIQNLNPWAGRRKQALAAEVARRSQTAVWQRVADRAIAMRSSEARGYIRARAAAVIHTRVDEVAAHIATGHERDELVQLATGEVLRLIIRQWVQARPGQVHVVPQRHAA